MWLIHRYNEYKIQGCLLYIIPYLQIDVGLAEALMLGFI